MLSKQNKNKIYASMMDQNLDKLVNLFWKPNE